ncbi:MAG: M20/M25/M40 family metallo-hydrolase [Clostridia bacterium]|nr:M20/M25/M40 family metallo-hydrolase [Clostridia bacterium]
MFELMQKLCGVLAPSGREYAMTETVKEMLTPFVDEVKVDVLGNVVGKICGTGGEEKKKILYLAHMDEVGFMVTYIESNGYIRFTNMGGPNLVSAAYQEVIFEYGTRGHIVPHTGSDGNLNYSTMVVDIGAKDKEDAKKYVKLGECFSALPHVTKLAGTMIGGRPLDDRIGCVILLEAAKAMKEARPYNDIYLAFTVQEETTANGATVSAFDIRPDIGIALDVCGTGDTIGAVPMETRCGDGAAILIRDSTLVADRELVNTMFAVAEEKGIRYQTEVYTHGGTDAVPMQKVALGAKAGVISIPMRYLHTSAEVLDLADAQACCELVVALSSHSF